MAYSAEQYEAIKDAYASGERVVRFKDRSIEFRSLDEMERIIARIEDDLYPKRRKRKVGVFYKGL